MLFEYNIDNVSVKFNNKEEAIHDLTPPFVAHLGTNFAIVSKISEEVHYVLDSKLQKMSIGNFVKLWDGIALFAEPTEYSHEPEYTKHHQMEIIDFVLKSTLACSITILMVLLFVSNRIYSNVYLISNFPL
jgi:ABC-type bacteriocin/lantibiotic exporter with double-glycine peptidase domain